MTARLSVARAAVFMIQLYRHTVSPLRLPTCRFTPTCSQYAVDALTEFGVIRGGWLAVVRLVKCGPWHNGGWDPIPDRVPDHAEYQGVAAECACGVTEHRTSTVQQGESQTRV
ncbi:putative membrane protein insertion efficiency factor [Mycolicibacterium cyprinidarum]|uniref:Putative membrane protein insertion efficiency factor n=1 Tax=Mycolicibacterium cyprinidarum TaxID=2860311 RepID=A0ABQ4VA93_9MYCO|nr:putative membrane protein insertion efficiency factor [Mycolicibacterium sp. NGTWSNA01]